MSQVGQELGIALFAVALFASATSVSIREESKAGALISVAAFFGFSLLAARLLWMLL